MQFDNSMGLLARCLLHSQGETFNPHQSRDLLRLRAKIVALQAQPQPSGQVAPDARHSPALVAEEDREPY